MTDVCVCCTTKAILSSTVRLFSGLVHIGPHVSGSFISSQDVKQSEANAELMRGLSYGHTSDLFAHVKHFDLPCVRTVLYK